MSTLRRSLIVISIVVLGLCLMNTNVLADPTVNNITTNPANPSHQDTITVTANITGDDVSSVELWVGECNSTQGICFIWNPYNMEQDQDGDWIATATLESVSGSSDYISYKFEIVDNETQYSLADDSWKLDFTVEDDTGDADGGADDNGGSGSPGFEIITLLAAIAIGVLLIRRKRQRF